MWFEPKIDSTPPEWPITGLEADLPPEVLPAEVPPIPRTSASSFAPAEVPAYAAMMSPWQDPGLAAAVAGGATLSEPMKWLLVTVAGICSAAVGQAVVASRPKPMFEHNTQQVSAQMPVDPDSGGELTSPEEFQPEHSARAIHAATAATANMAADGASRAISNVEPAQALRSMSEQAGTSLLPVETRPPVRTGGGVKPAVQAASAKAGQGKSTCIPVTRGRLFGSRRR